MDAGRPESQLSQLSALADRVTTAPSPCSDQSMRATPDVPDIKMPGSRLASRESPGSSSGNASARLRTAALLAFGRLKVSKSPVGDAAVDSVDKRIKEGDAEA